MGPLLRDRDGPARGFQMFLQRCSHHRVGIPRQHLVASLRAERHGFGLARLVHLLRVGRMTDPLESDGGTGAALPVRLRAFLGSWPEGWV